MIEYIQHNTFPRVTDAFIYGRIFSSVTASTSTSTSAPSTSTVTASTSVSTSALPTSTASSFIGSSMIYIFVLTTMNREKIKLNK